MQKVNTLAKVEKYDAGDVERTAGERWVTMSNALTRAGQGLSLAEKRLVMLAVSSLNSRRPTQPGELPTTKVTAIAYADEFGVDPCTAYEALQDASKALYNRSITFFEPAYKRNGQPLKPTRIDMRWVGECHYDKGEGSVTLAWWPRLLPSLTGLKSQFTSYQLQQASALRSAYSWRLLELLTRFKSTGVAEYSIEDFAASMDATEKQRADFAAIRRKIIEPAVKELTEKDGWKIKWEPVKAGRRVATVRFTFARDPQQRLDLGT
ncbi:MAG: replication protein [Pseudomonadota bacterium]